LVAALASWLDARAHGGTWLVRIEDVDTTRCLPGMDQVILQQLKACGLQSDRPPVYQSQRGAIYQQALNDLVQGGWAYPCGCSRKDIDLALQQGGHIKARHGELIYPGTCRSGLHGKVARAWRFCTDNHKENSGLPPVIQANEATNSGAISRRTNAIANAQTSVLSVFWEDRRLGAQTQIVATEVGDFILKRADGCFAYQLAVVVDDADQSITDVVRGADLVDNTARQILLQRALNLPTPRYLHTPLVLGINGEKLSKQNGAQAICTEHPLAALNQAANTLGLPSCTDDLHQALQFWLSQWQVNLVVPRLFPAASH
jgi:glutamyl-Q tRNA(Asp) synthetase